MAQIKVTKTQQRYLDAVSKLYAKTGKCIVRCVGEEVGCNSTSSVIAMLRRLCRLGLVKRVPYGSLTVYRPADTNEDAITALVNEVGRRFHDGESMPEWLLRHARAIQ